MKRIIRDKIMSKSNISAQEILLILHFWQLTYAK